MPPNKDLTWKAVLDPTAEVTSKTLAAIVAKGLAGKPYRFDATVSGMGQRYRGDQGEIVEEKIKTRYPSSAPMPINPVNWLAFFARTDAGVYVVDAERFLEKGKARMPATDARALGFARAIEDLGLLGLMPELERRALTGAKSVVLHVGWRKLGDDDDGMPVADMYWSSDALIICHPSAPNDDRAAVVVALRQTPTSAKEGVQVWWVWSRNYVDNPDGTVKSWDPWWHRMLRSDSTDPVAPTMYPGKLLPILFLRTEQADGCFWPTPERDTIAQVDELNIGRSNEQHVVDLQGHGQGVYSGTMNEAEQLPLGPDRWIKIGPNETITSVNFNPLLEEVRLSRQNFLREIAVSRSNNPDAYSMTPSTSESGISRKVANLPHDKRIRELRPIFRRFEELRMLPVIIEVLQLFAPQTYYPAPAPDDDEVVARVVFGVAPDFEELDQKQRRLEIDLKMGIVTAARYAVLMGHYDNEVAAVAAGLSNDLVPTDTPTASTAGDHAPVSADSNVDLNAAKQEKSTTPTTPAKSTTLGAAADAGVIQDTALNGAQVDALLALVDKVAVRSLPAGAVEQLLSMAFPAIPVEKIKALLKSLEGFKPAPPAGA